MKIKFKEHIIRINKSKSNNYINSHWNLYFSDIKIKGKWYPCQILCFNNYIEIYNPKRRIKKTGNFDQPYKGLYKRIETPFLKNQLIKFLLHRHPVNRFSYKFRTTLFKRKNTVLLFTVAFILAGVYFFTNEFYNDYLMNFIAKNNLIQSIIIFLTISSFINIFYPFTIKKQIDEKDIENITRETLKVEATNEKIERDSSF